MSRVAMYVPSHYECVSSLHHHLSEFSSCFSSADDCFILIENGLSKQESDCHKDYLKTYAKTFPVCHFTEFQQAYFVEMLTKDIQNPRIKNILLNSSFSYGRNPNLAYLISACLGVHYLTRRDSDVIAHPLKGVLPIQLEMEIIGSDYPKKLLDSSGGLNLHPMIIGTGTYGDPTIDRRDLFLAGDEIAVEFQSLGRPNVPLGEVRQEAYEYLVEEPLKKHEDIFVSRSRHHIEMECCGIKDLFREIPEVPASIIGCDYMNLDLARSVDLPVLYHSVKLEHRHRPFRLSSMTDVVAYKIRDIQYIQMGHVWRRHGARVRSNPNLYWNDGHLNHRAYVESFQKAMNDSLNDIKKVREGALRVFAKACRYSEGNLMLRRYFESIFNEVSKRGSSIDDVLVQGIDDFCYLVNSWRELIKSAECIDGEVFFMGND